MSLTQKEISRRHYEKKIQNGLCGRCGGPKDREGFYCSECLKEQSKYKKETRDFFRRHNLCTICGKVAVFGNERTCPECRAKRREIVSRWITPEKSREYLDENKNRAKRIYHERKAKGICTRCGKRKAERDKTRCGICLSKDAEAHRKKRDSKNHWSEAGLCCRCGKPSMPGRKLCEDHYKKIVASLAKARESKRVDVFKRQNDMHFLRDGSGNNE